MGNKKRMSNVKVQMPNACQSSNAKFDIGILTFGFHWDFGFCHLDFHNLQLGFCILHLNP